MRCQVLLFFKLPSMRTKYHIFSPTCTCKILLIASVIYFGQIYCFTAPCSPKLISYFDIYIYDLHLINEVFSIRKSGNFSVYQSKASFEFYQQQVYFLLHLKKINLPTLTSLRQFELFLFLLKASKYRFSFLR